MDERMMKEEVVAKALAAKLASRKMAVCDSQAKNNALAAIADNIDKNRKEIIFKNEIDIEAAGDSGLSAALIDRLKLDDKRIDSMVKGVKDIAAQRDPAWEVLEENTSPLGFKLQKIRVPLGLVGIIYESRPNVTVDASALCLKAGNAVILKGGREAADTNRQLYHTIVEALKNSLLPENAVQFIETADRKAVDELVKLDGIVDLIIARGGEEMIKSLREKAIVPILGHGRGLCHTYIDRDADIKMASEVAFNAKVQRPGVCNAMESLLINESIASKLAPGLFNKLKSAGVELRVCPKSKQFAPWAKDAAEQDYRTEYLDLILSVKIVDSVDEAIQHINKYGSGHTESIITNNRNTAERFLREVDAAAVFHNASTRLHDGGIFGLGAEIGISTQKLHARGTMGLKELTTTKYVLRGSGQVRS